MLTKVLQKEKHEDLLMKESRNKLENKRKCKKMNNMAFKKENEKFTHFNCNYSRPSIQ